jgi:excisionase family DNA binding protein
MQDLFLSSIPLSELRSIISEFITTAFTNNVNNALLPKEEDPFLKIDEVCKMLSVSRVTIHNWKRQGILPFHRISNKIYFKKSEVMASLKKANNRFANNEGGKQ